jgi:hypothetical protein
VFAERYRDRPDTAKRSKAGQKGSVTIKHNAADQRRADDADTEQIHPHRARCICLLYDAHHLPAALAFPTRATGLPET